MLAAPPAAVSFTFGIPDADVRRRTAGRRFPRPAHRHHARGGGARAAGGPDAPACRVPRPARTGAAWPTTTAPTRTGRSGRCWPPCAGARSCRWWPPAGWAAPRTSPTCWPGGPTWSRPGRPSCAAPRAARPTRRRMRWRSAFRADRRHPRLQRPAGPGARQRHGAGPPRRAGGLPRDQQRHPPLRAAAAQAGDAQHMSLYAGTGFRPAEARPAAEVVERLVSGWRRVSRDACAKKTIEFTPPDVAAVADALRPLRAAGDGWINLLPGIDEEASEVHPRAGLFAFFGNNAAPVTMTTLMPPKKDRRDTEGLTIGAHAPDGRQGRGAPGRGRRDRPRRVGGAPGPRPAGPAGAHPRRRGRGRRGDLVRAGGHRACAGPR